MLSFKTSKVIRRPKFRLMSGDQFNYNVSNHITIEKVLFHVDDVSTLKKGGTLPI